jgi:chemotaxis protein methyltransferase CheR
VPPGISEPVLARVSDLVATHLGLHFPRERWRDLERGLKAAATELGFSQAAACAEWLISSPVPRDQIDILAGHLIVPETYFFREPKSMEILETQVLPQLIRARQGGSRRLRLWSAGCSSGEEPYSLAILLQRLLPARKDWEITILATDISQRSLQKARAGVYTRWSFRGTGQDFKDRYFRKNAGGHYALQPEIKEMVTFSQQNLAADPYPSRWNQTAGMDLIICRNVLMYLTPEVAGRVLGNLCRCLVDGGWLLISAAEGSLMRSLPLVAVDFSGAIFYRKEPEPRVMPVEAAAAPLGIPAAAPGEPGRIRAASPATPPAPDDAPSPLPLPPPGARDDLRPDQVAVLPYEEALALYRQGHYAAAEAKLLELLASDADNVAAMTLVARTCANQGKLAEALGWGAKVAATDKLNPHSHYLLATILQEQGRGAEAAAALKRSLYVDQDFVLAHFTLGHLALAERKTQESRRHFANVLALLESYGQDDPLPEAEGMTAGRLREMVAALGRRA